MATFGRPVSAFASGVIIGASVGVVMAAASAIASAKADDGMTEVCAGMQTRMADMTAKQLELIIAAPAAPRVIDACTALLERDIAAGHRCLAQTCADVDAAGIVARTRGSLDDRLSTCATVSAELAWLTRSLDILQRSMSQVCRNESWSASGG